MDVIRLPPTRGVTGVAIGTAAAAVLYTVAMTVGRSYGLALFSLPFFVGFLVGALCFDRPYRRSFYCLGFSLLLSILLLQEGVICVLFSLPVLVPLLIVGAFSGSTLVRRTRSRRARDASTSIVFFLGLAWQVWDGTTDDPRRHPIHVAESQIAIDATPQTVFSLLTTGTVSVAPRWHWFLRVGLPMPESMTVEARGLGGRVRFDFVQGTAFARITEWDPPREVAFAVERYVIDDLPFHITRLGKSPDYGFRAERVEDWLTIEDTRYTLEPAANGGAILRRRVVWRRHLAPALYFEWLQQTVMERGQVRLLELIAERSEEPAREAPGAVETAMLDAPGAGER